MKKQKVLIVDDSSKISKELLKKALEEIEKIKEQNKKSIKGE